MQVKKGIEQLSRKRWIPMYAVILIGIILIVTGTPFAKYFQGSIIILDSPNRSYIIWFLGTVVGAFHFFHITRKKIETKHTLINSSLGFIDSMFSAWGYCLVVDKAIDVASGILKELVESKAFFVYPSKIDCLSFGVVSLVIVLIGAWKIWQMGREAVFTVKHTLIQTAATEKKD